MAERKIDYDRGCLKMIHPLGIEVYMYYDEPGMYMNAYGTEISEDFAREAGFDVERLGKARKRKELFAAAHQGVLDQLAQDDAGVHDVVRERGGVSVVDIGIGRFVIEDADGTRLSPAHMSKEAALNLLDRMIPEEKASPAVEAKNPIASKGLTPKA